MPSMTCSSSFLQVRIERTLYLCHSSKDKAMVDLHLIVLVDKDGADVVFVS